MSEVDAGDASVSVVPLDLSAVLMDDALQRMRLLGYEAGFCAPRDLAPFHRMQFAVAGSNASTQLSLFLGVVAWLLGEAKRKFSFNRDDDPSTSISKMLAELRGLGAGAEILDASPLKLRAAWGETACRILLFCADAALSAKGFKWSRPSYPVEPKDDVVEEEDDRETEDIDDAAIEEDDMEDDALFSTSSPSTKRDENATVLHSSVDPAAWRAELERVASRLRAPIPLGGGSMLPSGYTGGGLGGALGGARAGARGHINATAASSGSILGEWRAHLEATTTADKTVTTLLSPAFESLRRLMGELNEVSALVNAREAALNTAFASLVAEHGEALGASAELGASAAAAQARVTGLTSELAAISEALDEVQGAMEERGSSLSDASPLINIKAALAAMRADIKDLDVQLGVQGHAVMQIRLATRNAAQQKVRDSRR